MPRRPRQGMGSRDGAGVVEPSEQRAAILAGALMPDGEPRWLAADLWTGLLPHGLVTRIPTGAVAEAAREAGDGAAGLQHSQGQSVSQLVCVDADMCVMVEATAFRPCMYVRGD